LRDPNLQSGDLPVEIPVIEEQLVVSRLVVETGAAVRIRKDVHQETVSITEPLRLDGVEVTRKSIGRDVDGPVPIRYDGDVTIIPVVAERLVVSKQLVLVEEIHLRRSTRVEPVTRDVTLRREEALVERRESRSDDWREPESGREPEKT
jgi:uncharacterized protein (TIGR02271 family)